MRIHWQKPVLKSVFPQRKILVDLLFINAASLDKPALSVQTDRRKVAVHHEKAQIRRPFLSGKSHCVRKHLSSHALPGVLRADPQTIQITGAGRRLCPIHCILPVVGIAQSKSRCKRVPFLRDKKAAFFDISRKIRTGIYIILDWDAFCVHLLDNFFIHPQQRQKVVLLCLSEFH